MLKKMYILVKLFNLILWAKVHGSKNFLKLSGIAIEIKYINHEVVLVTPLLKCI